MPNYNKVLLMGNLTRDPELRYTPNNTPVVNIGLAVNRRWRDQNGESRDETTFVDCEGWSRTAEVINQYLRKGRPIFIEGRLKLDQWQDKEGNNRSKLKIVIDNFQFVDSRGDQVESNTAEPTHGFSSGQTHEQNTAVSEPAGARQPVPSSGQTHEPVPENDIPF